MPKKKNGLKTHISYLLTTLKSFTKMSYGRTEKSLKLYEKHIAKELEKFDITNDEIRNTLVSYFIKFLAEQRYELCNAIKKAVNTTMNITDHHEVKDAMYDKFIVSMHYQIGSYRDVCMLFQLSGKSTLEEFKEEANYKFKKFGGIEAYCKALLAFAVFDSNDKLFELALAVASSANFEVEYIHGDIVQKMPFIQCVVEKGGDCRLVAKLIQMVPNIDLQLNENALLIYLSWQLKTAIDNNDSKIYSCVVETVKTVAPELQHQLVDYLYIEGVEQSIIHSFSQHTEPVLPFCYVVEDDFNILPAGSCEEE